MDTRDARVERGVMVVESGSSQTVAAETCNHSGRAMVRQMGQYSQPEHDSARSLTPHIRAPQVPQVYSGSPAASMRPQVGQ